MAYDTYNEFHRVVFMALRKAVFVRNKKGGLRVFFSKKIRGAKTFFLKK